MFTGIVQGIATRRRARPTGPACAASRCAFRPGFAAGLAIGASVAVDGVCLTVTALQGGDAARFDVMQQSLALTTLGGAARRQPRQRRARGHATAPRSAATRCRATSTSPATVAAVRRPENNHVLRIAVPAPWMRYVFAKGYIAVNGASLTVAEARPAARAGSRSG
ncbi:MAG: hypothetical protein MZW92_73560 [Comamonadaceae bacterium]|nr:hypothetical protein [Comamonadaceae bacterium]